MSKTPLMNAIEEGNLPLVKQIIRDCDGLLDEVDENGETALFYAARSGMEEIIKSLIYEGADFTIKNKQGQTIGDIEGFPGDIADPAFIDFPVFINSTKNFSEKRISRCYGDIKDYTGQGDIIINKAIRTKNYDALFRDANAFRAIIDIFRALRDSPVVSKPTEVFRGLESYPGFKCESIQNGDTIMMGGISSFSTDIYRAMNFVKGNSSCIIATDFQGIHALSFTKDTSFHPGEKEIITYPNITIKVTNIDYVRDYRTIYVKVIDEGIKNILDLPGFKEALVEHNTSLNQLIEKSNISKYLRAFYMLASQYNFSQDQYRRLIDNMVGENAFWGEKYKRYYFFDVPNFAEIIDTKDFFIFKDIYNTKKLLSFYKNIHVSAITDISLKNLHTEEFWKLRQDPVILSIVRKILGVQDIEVDFFPILYTTTYSNLASPRESDGVFGALILESTEMVSYRQQAFYLDKGDIVFFKLPIKMFTMMGDDGTTKYLPLCYHPAGKPSKEELAVYKNKEEYYYTDRISSFEQGIPPYSLNIDSKGKTIVHHSSNFIPPKLTEEGWRLLGKDINTGELMTLGGEYTHSLEIPRCGDV